MGIKEGLPLGEKEVVTEYRTCPRCHGSGQGYGHNDCLKCEGAGRIPSAG